MNSILSLIGRKIELFSLDVLNSEDELQHIISSSSFLVLGGAGSIGQAVTKEIFKRNPNKLHIVDISENNMVELVRDVRSSMGYVSGDFQTLTKIDSLEMLHLVMKSVTRLKSAEQYDNQKCLFERFSWQYTVKHWIVFLMGK